MLSTGLSRPTSRARDVQAAKDRQHQGSSMSMFMFVCLRPSCAVCDQLYHVEF